MPNAMPPIATMPAAKPSSPSTKFTALIETTISKAVIAMEIIGDAVSRPPIGSEMICRPPHATNTEMSSWPASLSIQSRSHTSSATPSRQIIAAPAITTQAWWFWRNSPCRKLSLEAKNMAVMKPSSMATPPMRGVGTVCTSRARTSPTAPS